MKIAFSATQPNVLNISPLTKGSKITLVALFLLISPFSKSQCTFDFKTTKAEFKTLKGKENKIHFLDSLQQIFDHCLTIKQDSSAADGYYFLARRHKSIKNYEKAILYDEQALSIRKRIYPKDHLLLARSYWAIGSCKINTEKYSEAITSFKQAIAIHRQNKKSADQDLLARTYRDLGYAFIRSGDYQNAAQHSRLAAEIYTQEKDTFFHAYTLNDVAINFLKLQLPDSALIVLDQAESLSLQFQNGTNARSLRSLSAIYINKGIAYYEKGAYEPSLVYYQKALDSKDLLKEDYYKCLTNIGIIHKKHGNFNKALSYFKESLRTAENHYATKNHPKFVINYYNIGELYFAQGQYHTALAYYQKTLQQMLSNKAALELVNTAADDPYPNPNIEIHTLNGRLSTVLDLLESKATALQKLKKSVAALATYRTADQLIDLMRKEHSEENSKLFWRKTTRPVYEAAIDLAFQLEDTEAAFYFMEKSKAVLLADALNELQAKEKAQLPRDILEAIKEDQKKVAAARESGDTDRYLRAKEKQAQLIAKIEQEFPAYYQFKYQQLLPDLQTIQADLLADGTTLVEYFVGEDFIFAIQIDKKEQHLHRIPYEQKHFDRLQEMLVLAATPNLLETSYLDSFLLANKVVSDLLRPSLSFSSPQVVISPDAWLSYLNFELLLSPSSASTHEAPSRPKIPYLILEKTFNYTYSVTVLQYTKQKKTQASQQFLGIAPSQFNDLPDLANSKAGLKAIHQYIQGNCLTDSKANYAKLETKLKQNWRIVHFATHAQADKGVPYIALADQRLFLPELYRLNLAQTELATLSACESSIGQWQEGEGLMSLARACTYAGARAVVASQWRVEEEATATLMTNFYHYLALGDAKDVALRKAKMHLLKKGAPPAQWAAFVSIGNAAPILGLEGGGGLGWAWYVGLSLLLGFGFYKIWPVSQA